MSCKDISNTIDIFAKHCVFISDNEEGDYDDIEQNGNNDYPLLFLNPINASVDKAIANYKVQIHLLDYATDNVKGNELRCVQKMHNVALILRIWLSKCTGYTPENFTINTIYNFGNDRTHGVMIDFDINLGYKCFADIKNVVLDA